MEYQALYRQFRPAVFSDMVGQEHIVTALVNQIKTNKLAHAYLFCGTRGTGKTTTARILSRAVNCENPNGAEPCNECDVCQSILNGSTVDIVEIDAASNNGVDDVRQIIEEVAYLPVMSKFKVYIIDEVHMLSDSAFNALLKTLEEPPEHVIFILATTEYHKIPATILSRCQRFDFRRITSSEIQNRLKYVCQQGNVEIEEDALSIISYAADGSMRDGLSILDKCISFDNGKITSESVSKILGVVDDNDMFCVSESIAKKDLAEVIKIISKSISQGRDPILFTSYLIEHFRCILIAALVKEPNEILQMSKERTEKFVKCAEWFSINQLVEYLKALNGIYKQQKESPNPKVMLEIGIAELCQDGEKVAVADNVKRTVSTYSKPQEPVKDIEPLEEKKQEIKSEIKEPQPKGIGGGVVDSWNEVISELKQEGKMMLSLSIVLARPVDKGDTLEILFKPQNAANKNMIDNAESESAVSNAFYRVTGRNVKVKFLVEGQVNNQMPSKSGNVMDLAKQFPDIVSIDESED